MGYIRPKEFELPDEENPDYSFVEYDLYAKLGMSIRKNLIEDQWEIFMIKTGKSKYSGSLEYIVKKANELEGAENTTIKV
jgi:hypothetical protein